MIDQTVLILSSYILISLIALILTNNIVKKINEELSSAVLHYMSLSVFLLAMYLKLHTIILIIWTINIFLSKWYSLLEYNYKI